MRLSAQTILPFLCLAFISVSTLQAEVKKGYTREQVIKELGEPTGVVALGVRENLSYSGGTIKLKNGLVYFIDVDFYEKQAAGMNADEFSKQQRAKGLISYQGEWITVEEAKRREGADAEEAKKNNVKKQGGDFRDIRDNGKKVVMNKVLAPGKVTLVDFHADWCGPCKQLSPYLEQIIAADSSVALRKIDIVNWGTPVTEQFGINSVPNVRIYGADGKMVGRPTSSLGEIKKYIEMAKQQG